MALCFIHQLAGPDLAGRRPLQVAWALLYTYASRRCSVTALSNPLALRYGNG